MKPAHQVLTPAQREELRRTLETKKAQLLATIREHEDLEDSESETDPGDAADMAEQLAEATDRRARADRDVDLLEEVDSALTRLNDGTYGVSEASGRPISFERLRAVPWARYDADEAERIEHAGR
jgi:DnaK suppressor protein